MRSTLSLFSPLATAALCAAAFSPAIAQRAAAPDHVRPVVKHAALTVDAAPLPLRTVAVYRFATSPNADLPTQVMVADSAGRLVATFRLPDGRSARPMTVDVVNTDILLQGETPSGLLTLVLYRQNDPKAADAFGGHWTLGDHQGELHGRSGS